MSDNVSAFTPARLSPMPVDGRPEALPFGLSWNDLRPCSPDFTQPGEAWVSHAVRGLHKDRSRILTLRYRDAEGGPRMRTVFVKVANSAAEGAKYRFLSARGVPVARLLHAVREVIVLEFLPTIGIEPHEADDLLALIARLNTVEHAPGELFDAGPGMPGYDLRVAAALARLGRPAWFAAYRHAQRLVADVPLALNHGELFFQQVGWSGAGGTRSLVLFDLETAAMLPRFSDLATVLRGLAVLTGRAERELFAGYLRNLAGTALDESAAWRELLAVRVVRSFHSLPWLLDREGSADVAATPSSAAPEIRDDLAALGLLP